LLFILFTTVLGTVNPCTIVSTAGPGHYPRAKTRAVLLSRISRIPYPDFYPSRIPDPKTATKERGEKKLVVITFYVATNFTKLQIILVLEC
jgi:hypothetical protein